MVAKTNLETQGISPDWSMATGDFDTVPRGECSRAQILSAMVHLSKLDTPQEDDSCPPHVLVHLPSGVLSFTGQGASIYCIEADQEMTPQQATDLATGKVSLTVPPPPPLPVSSGNSLRRQSAETRKPKRKFDWRGIIVLLIGLCFWIAAAVALAGVVSMTERGVKTDDILVAVTVAIMSALIGLGLVILAFRNRSSHDGSDGSVAHIVTGETLGSSSYDFDDDFS